MRWPKKIMKRFIQLTLTTIETVPWVGYNPGASMHESRIPQGIQHASQNRSLIEAVFA